MGFAKALHIFRHLQFARRSICIPIQTMVTPWRVESIHTVLQGPHSHFQLACTPGNNRVHPWSSRRTMWNRLQAKNKIHSFCVSSNPNWNTKAFVSGEQYTEHRLWSLPETAHNSYSEGFSYIYISHDESRSNESCRLYMIEILSKKHLCFDTEVPDTIFLRTRNRENCMQIMVVCGPTGFQLNWKIPVALRETFHRSSLGFLTLH
jgi:hypothetical protein